MNFERLGLTVWAIAIVAGGWWLATGRPMTAQTPAPPPQTVGSNLPADTNTNQWWWLDNDIWTTMQAEGPRCEHSPPTNDFGSPKALYDVLKQKWQFPRIDDLGGGEVDVTTVDEGVTDTTRFFRGEKACLIALAPFRDQWKAAKAKDRDTERYR